MCTASSEIAALPKRKATSLSPAALSSDTPGEHSYPQEEIKTCLSEKGG